MDMRTGKFFQSLPCAAGLRFWCGSLSCHGVSLSLPRLKARWVRSPKKIRCLTHVSTPFEVTSRVVICHLFQFMSSLISFIAQPVTFQISCLRFSCSPFITRWVSYLSLEVTLATATLVASVDFLEVVFSLLGNGSGSLPARSLSTLNGN